MGDPYIKYKNALSTILRDNIYMYSITLKKFEDILQETETLDALNVERIHRSVKNTFESVLANLSSFVCKFNESALEYNGYLTFLHALPLIEFSNFGETLTNLKKHTIIEEECKNIPEIKQNESISLNFEHIDSTDDELDCSIPLGYFDAKQNAKHLDTTTSDGTKGTEDTSFDFDEDPKESNTNQEDKEIDIHENNQELLKLLSMDEMFKETTTKEVEEALALLDAEDRLSVASSSTSSELSDDEWTCDDLDEVQSSSDSNPEDSETSTEDKEDVQQDCRVKLKRLEELDEKEIDRLCSLHNIGKTSVRRAAAELKRPLKRKRRILSTSSESSSSDSSSTGSTTPDFLNVIPDNVPNMSPINCAADLLAEIYCDQISSDEECDSDKENVREESPKKKQKRHNSLDEDNDIGSESDDEDRTRSSWRNDPLLKGRLSSDTSLSEDSDKDVVPTKPKTERVSQRSNTVIQSEPIKTETTVISDSDSSTDSDVEFVDIDESNLSESPGGRRNIRKILTDAEVSQATKKAKTMEELRVQRLESQSKILESVIAQNQQFVLDVDVNTNAPLVTVDPALDAKLKPHQRNGVKFMWQACFESLEMCKSTDGSGCILAHCMGLGKTFQVITLIHTLFAHPETNTKKVLIVSPLSIVSNWNSEFNIAFDLLDRKPDIKLFYVINETFDEKCEIILRWHREKGVLVLGYEAFQILTTENKKRRFPIDLRKALFDALVNSGPDLVVCDEGHLLKNGDTLRTKALMNVKTKRRIVLTGTPLQNRLAEYYFMVEFVKPYLLGTYDEYKNRFVNPIMNGQFHNSNTEDIQLMKKRTHVLTKLLKKTVDRVESKVLEQYLPEILDYTITLTLHPLQKALYENYIEFATNTGLMFFKDFTMTKYITLHPYALHQRAISQKKTKKKERETVALDYDSDGQHKEADEWYAQANLNQPDIDANVDYGTKMKMIFSIIDACLQVDDKLLIFSISLVELDCVEHFLKNVGTDYYPVWQPNVDYYRMDGTVKPSRRNELCNKFNDTTNTSVKVFLIAEKVGGLGLNLTAANRVILLGSNFNPAIATQSIYRAYRFGQKKKVFVYRLLSMGTMEEKVYQKCVVKLAVAGTVVDKRHITRHYKQGDLVSMYQYKINSDRERPIPLVPKDKILANLLQTHNEIFSYHEHDALLTNRPEEELNDEEKNNAWKEFNEMEVIKQNACPKPIRPPQKFIRILHYPDPDPLINNGNNARFQFIRVLSNTIPKKPSEFVKPLPIIANGRNEQPKLVRPRIVAVNDVRNPFNPENRIIYQSKTKNVHTAGPIDLSVSQKPYRRIAHRPRYIPNPVNMASTSGVNPSNNNNKYGVQVVNTQSTNINNANNRQLIGNRNGTSSTNATPLNSQTVDSVAEFNYALNKVL